MPFRFNSRFIGSSVLALLASTPSVLAQQDVFSSLSTLTGGSGLADFYASNAAWIDAIVFFFLFFYVSRFAFSKQEGMRKVAGIMGVALAVGAIVAENTFGFNLGMLGPFALALALVIVAFTVYKAIAGMGLGGSMAWAFAYIIAYGFLTTAAAELFAWINETVPFVGALIAVGLVIALIAAIVGIFRWAGAGFKFGVSTSPDDVKKKEENATKEEEKETERDRRDGKKEAEEEDEEKKDVDKADELLDADIDAAKKLLDFLNKLRGRNPADALRIIKERADDILKAVNLLLTYSEQAGKAIENASKRGYDVLRLLKAELTRRAKVDAAAESEKIPAEQANKRQRVYNSTLREFELNNTARINALKNEAIEAEKGEVWIRDVIKKIIEMETEIKAKVNVLINSKTSVEATNALNVIIPSLEEAIKQLSQARKFCGAVASRLAKMLGLTVETEKSLAAEKVAEQYEIAQEKK